MNNNALFKGLLLACTLFFSIFIKAQVVDFMNLDSTNDPVSSENLADDLSVTINPTTPNTKQLKYNFKFSGEEIEINTSVVITQGTTILRIVNGDGKVIFDKNLNGDEISSIKSAAGDIAVFIETDDFIGSFSLSMYKKGE